MTRKELRLLEIAKEIIGLNKRLGAKISGSLMLSLMGINKRREAKDIDIICDYLTENDGIPLMPKDFSFVLINGRKSCVSAIQFINHEGIKVDFINNGGEPTNEVDGMPCGELNNLIVAKFEYSLNDEHKSSREKHALDLIYLRDNNPKLYPYFKNLKLAK